MISQLLFGKKLYVIILISLLSASSLLAAKIKYPVAEIPDSITLNAKAVIRKNTVEFTLHNLNRSTTHQIIAITVLDRSGSEHAAEIFFYDKNKEINSISASLYNQYGVEIERYSKKDFEDISYDPYGSIYNDARALSMKGRCNEYPYTIEYEVTTTDENSYSMPSWRPIEYYDQGLEYSKLIVNVPVDYKIKYQEISLPIKVQETISNNSIQYVWELKNIPAIQYESYAPPYYERLPRVHLSPTFFEYESYQGDLSSWNKYGAFINKLNAGRDDISDELKNEIKALVAGESDPIEKAKKIYRYMQDNTRYVSIQIGIGGLQTFPASTVEEFGYGDCKALTNYMQSLLKAVDIDSYFSLVRAGKYQYYYDTNFVHHAHNHAILYLPMEGEDIWLECTSQMIPFGFLGDFTDNRYALVVSEEGGRLKKTSSYTDELSKTNRSARVNIMESGQANADIRTSYSGLYYDNILTLLHTDYERQKDKLYERIAIPGFKINSFVYQDNPGRFPNAIEKLELELSNYATVSGSRIFIPVNLMNKLKHVPRRNSDRENPFRLQRDYNENDTIVYQLPNDFEIEHVPKNIAIESKFGKYSAECEVSSREIRYIRHFESEQGEHPKELYDEFVDFLRSISKADKQKIVIVRKAG